jgi:histidinol-phosphate phosphatase family protein
MPTLFLDRDGVLNVRQPGEYVVNPDEFIPASGMEEAVQMLSKVFNPIVVVTNQSGIGRGLLTEDNLHAIHVKMLSLTDDAGGRIDAVYHCPHAPNQGCPCRKPATGMAWQALADFPDIDFTQSWLVGDSISDIEFGRNLGMRTVMIDGKTDEANHPDKIQADHRFDSLLAFARFMC